MASMKVPKLFNGPVEVGLRSLAVLLEAYPEGLDLQRLVTLDYLVIHSGDVPGGPRSLHPPSPLRAGEVAVRRGLIEAGLHLYASHGLVSRALGSDGIQYVADDAVASFMDAMRSEYVGKLRERAEWAFATFGSLHDRELEQVLSASMGRWRTEFAFLDGEDERI